MCKENPPTSPKASAKWVENCWNSPGSQTPLKAVFYISFLPGLYKKELSPNTLASLQGHPRVSGLAPAPSPASHSTREDSVLHAPGYLTYVCSSSNWPGKAAGTLCCSNKSLLLQHEERWLLCLLYRNKLTMSNKRRKQRKHVSNERKR